MKRLIPRRAVSIALVLFGLFTAISGLWNFFPPLNAEFSPGHAVGACIFGILCIVHIWLNWKPLIRYLRGLGWWWILVGLGLAGLIPLLIVPVLRM
jgi:hypothetical protein